MKRKPVRLNQAKGLDAPKRSYKTPKLTRLGLVKNLTLGGTSAFFDEGAVRPLLGDQVP